MAGDRALQEQHVGGLNAQVEAFRKSVLLHQLELCGWRKKDAAAALGLSPRALSHYVVKFDLDSHRS